MRAMRHAVMEPWGTMGITFNPFFASTMKVDELCEMKNKDFNAPTPR